MTEGGAASLGSLTGGYTSVYADGYWQGGIGAYHDYASTSYLIRGSSGTTGTSINWTSISGIWSWAGMVVVFKQ